MSKQSMAQPASVRAWLGASILAASGFALSPWQTARADEPATQQQTLFTFAISAKPLPQALSEFSRITGLGVIYTQEAPYSIKAPALAGRFSAEQALTRLLSQSGFIGRRATDRAFTLEAASSEGMITLARTQIDSRLQSAGSYQPPIGSSVARSSTPTLETPQVINIVAAQVLRDQAPRNLDDRSEERRVGKECRSRCDWSSDVCSSDLQLGGALLDANPGNTPGHQHRCGPGAARPGPAQPG